MSTQMELMITLLYLMEREIKCLRSVLSEFDGDKSNFIQWIRAENLRQVIEDLVVSNEHN